ncbi:MAG: hypothetical protein F4Z31_23395 [Gemmatimonadetes bacterium]|nr:hypothetical protein [Gemmatimonadota bacterium]MCY3676673.1 hypothetical protein [Gemmatimonadota bacterium]MYA44680.1 hypothetical protein [Gemmatimonadota bacterium]MYE92835.1 hypothetical protein [Gemmatimonadota bacterium]MYJ11295.1 hypothetical protein [Gemmatimonadota bacterium]
MILKIIFGIAAFALGIYLGLPGRSGPVAARGRRWLTHDRGRTATHDEAELQQLERDLGLPTTLSRRAKRYFTPLDLMKRRRRASERRRTRRRFHTAAPTSGRGDKGPGSRR